MGDARKRFKLALLVDISETGHRNEEKLDRIMQSNPGFHGVEFSTAHENFVEAQKWRGISRFVGGTGHGGGQQPNYNFALQYYDAALRIEPTHEYAISHRAYCLWSLGRRQEAV